MEEENKVVEAEVVSEETQEAPAKEPMNPNKAALIAFILTCVALTLCGIAFFGNLAAIICGAIGLNFLKKTKGAELTNPYRVFAKIAKPVGIVSVILGAVLLVVSILLSVLAALGVIAGAGIFGIGFIMSMFSGESYVALLA